jgi:hypothetical protein
MEQLFWPEKNLKSFKFDWFTTSISRVLAGKADYQKDIFKVDMTHHSLVQNEAARIEICSRVLVIN